MALLGDLLKAVISSGNPFKTSIFSIGRIIVVLHGNYVHDVFAITFT